MLLNALEKAGGEDYLARLAIENSSAFSSLIGKIMPLQHAAASESDGGAKVELRFTREIVWPDGRREIQGVTPKQLPAPDAALPRPTDLTDDTNEGAV